MPFTHVLAVLFLLCYPLCLFLIYVDEEEAGFAVALVGLMGCLSLLWYGI